MMQSKSKTVPSLILFILLFVPGAGMAQFPPPSKFEAEFRDLIGGAQQYVVMITAQSGGVEISETVQSNTGKQAKSTVRSILDKNVGSGMIVDPSGIVLTRRSVIDRMDVFTVELHSGEEVNAKLLGIDNAYGVAVLRVPPVAIANPSFANESWLKNGNWIFTMGIAKGLSPPVSVGMVEAMLSEKAFLISARAWRGCIGAPVFSLAGQVVGILAALAETGEPKRLEWSDHDDYVVIPIAPMIPTIASIVERKAIPVAWVGITIKLSEAVGSLFEVLNIEENSPAAKADIQIGDQLISFNGQAVRSLGEMNILVKNMVLNDSIRFELKRGNEIIQRKVGISVRQSPTLSTQRE